MSTATITNNTISGNTSSSSGGGIYSSGTVTITNNIISGNTSPSAGGGIYSNGTVVITNNTISGNTASFGGGIASYSGTATITSNIICNNTAANQGGGINIDYATSTITSNIISNNTAKNRSAVSWASGGSCNFLYNTITGNKATENTNQNADAVHVGAYPLINYNNIYGNFVTYELWYDKPQGSNNLDATNNWWGTKDDSAVQAKIYDWIDNSTLGMVDYYPFETAIRTDCPISPPTGFTATVANRKIDLEWTANTEPDANGYKVYWDTDSGHPYANVADVGKVTSYNITGLDDGKYYVTVTAYDTTYSPARDDDSTVVNENQTNGNESWYAVEKDVKFSIDSTPPTVISTIPADKATDVAVDTVVSATFSEAMNAATITTSTFTLSGGVAGTVSYHDATKTATFTPSADLEHLTTYIATITKGVKDVAGNNMAANYTWKFATVKSVCQAESITASPGTLMLQKGKSGTITITVAGEDDCPVAGVTVTATTNGKGNQLVTVSPGSQETDTGGQAVFTITAKDKKGTAVLKFNANGLNKFATVKAKVK